MAPPVVLFSRVDNLDIVPYTFLYNSGQVIYCQANSRLVSYCRANEQPQWIEANV